MDRVAGSDPGLNRLRLALLSVLTIGLILVAEWLFVRYTHALQLPASGPGMTAAQTAAAAVANHEYLVIAMLLGAIVGMMGGFGVLDTTARGQFVSTLLVPALMIPALALGIALGGHRMAALASFAVLLGVGTYFRRFGPRGFIVGVLLFMGDFFGFFLYGAVSARDLGWLAAEIGVGLVVALAVRFTLFYPRRAAALERTRRSYTARERRVAGLALAVFDGPDRERAARRLQRQLVRLNEAALMIDAQLGDPGTVPDGSSAQRLHQRLFDAELALTNIARFAGTMSGLALPAAQRAEIRQALIAVVARDAQAARAHARRLRALLPAAEPAEPGPSGADRTAIVLPHRFAASVIVLADVMDERPADPARAIADATADGSVPDGSVPDGSVLDGPAFEPAVLLFGGWLPGSSAVSGTASAEAAAASWLERGGHWSDRIRLAPYTRVAIQMLIAVGAATALGDVLSGRRFYWAVIAAFITFMGTNNSGEQVRKALFRVLGTAVGIAIGSLLVTVVGDRAGWSIAVILAALFLGFYLMRINYVFMVIGITVMVAQLYAQLGEFSNSLLVLRLEETTLGAVVAAAVVLFVLPLRTRRVLLVAMRDHVQAVARLTGDATAVLLGGDPAARGRLRADARALDVCYQALVATVEPMRRNLFGRLDPSTGQAVRLATATRHYCRNLVTDAGAASPLDESASLQAGQAAAVLLASLAVIGAAVNGRRDVTYTRSSALFDQAERRLERFAGRPASPAQLAIRDLKLIDAAMAGLAGVLGLTLADSGASSGAGPDAPAEVTLRGRVRGAGGAGVPRAALTLMDSRGRQMARTLAAADGRYHLDAPAAGAYVLITSAASYWPDARPVVVPGPGPQPGTGLRQDIQLGPAPAGAGAGAPDAGDGGYWTASAG